MRSLGLFPVLAFAAFAARADAGSEMLPSALIRIPESVSSVFVAEVATAQFHRFENSAGELTHAGTFYMSIGEAGAGKQKSGDKRTPLGVYFVTERLDTSRLHEKYGVTAFPLDYPNAWDQRAQRSGDGIWIHGVDPAGGKRPAQDTDGCIALPNRDLLDLVPDLKDNVTPVVVTHDIAWSDESSNDALRSELEASVDLWAASQARGDLHAYLSSYDEDFDRWGLSKAEWALLSLQSASPRESGEIEVSDLLLLRYPEERGIYLSRFRLRKLEPESTAVFMKRLYWRRDKHGALKIIAENDG